jgi:subtilisin family serine protease
MKFEKLSPGLLTAWEDYDQEGGEGLTPHLKTLGVVPSLGTPKPARTVVFIACDENANFDQLAAEGVIVNQLTGKMRTGFLPIASLGALSNHEQVDRILSSRYRHKCMDVAPGHVKIPQFRNTNNLNGHGVVIGIVDTGIDPNHPAFAARILRIWDQTMSGPGVAEGGYGLELTGPTLTASRDKDGHGTHVAGIAAGSDQRFGGVAPGAHIVFVKTDFQDAHIADGIRYIFRVARELDQPAVVNLSVGGHWDAHDGTDPLAQIVTSESGAGRIVCCAAGNEGNDNIHGQTMLAPNQSRTMRFHLPNRSLRTGFLNGWYPGAASLEVSVSTPGGFVTPPQPVINTGSATKLYHLPDARVRVTTTRPDPANGDHHFLVQVSGPAAGTKAKGGTWRLILHNTSATEARVDIWAIDDEEGTEVTFTGVSKQDSMKIGSPGCSSAAVTVAAFTTKNEWVDINGDGRIVTDKLNDIADFSSEGPLRNNQPKPDVTAPGGMIVSALSRDSKQEKPDMIDLLHLVEGGTSMATPFIVGTIALLLQRNPQLDPAGVKNLLHAASKVPHQAAGAFDPKWGFGLIDAQRL